MLYDNTNGPGCEGRGSWFSAKVSRCEARGPRALGLGPWIAKQGRTLRSCCRSAIGRAWIWRRRIEADEFATIQELADAVGLAERHVSRQLRLAYLAPEVLKRLLFGREVIAVTAMQLTESAALPWVEQAGVVFGTTN